MKIDVITQQSGEPVNVRLHGNITGESAQNIVEDVRHSLYSRALDMEMLCDMQDVDFIDSSGVGAILTLNKNFEADQGRIVFHSFSPTVSGMIKLLNLGKILNVSEDLDSARKKLVEVSP